MSVYYEHEHTAERTAKKKKEAYREIAEKNKKAKQTLTEQARRQKAGQCWD